MNILYVTSELVPYVKIGGLADVSGSLPKAIETLGHEIHIIIPKYSQLDTSKSILNTTGIKLAIPHFKYKGEIEKTEYPDSKIVVYFVKCDYFYDRGEIYGDYEDDAERSIFFSKSVLEFLKFIDWTPDIIHCNDWQTGLIPILLKTLYKHEPRYKNIRTLFTIHNLAYQGIFAKEKFQFTGLEERYFSKQGLEFWGKMNLMKAGIVFADILNTVSEKYAQEIQTKEFGYGLENYLLDRRNDLFGILNGIDYDIWDPRRDSFIWENYDETLLEKKQHNKQNLQKLSNLPPRDVPLIGMISRIVDQKGFDLIEEIIEDLLELDLQFILLGTGQTKYHKFFDSIGKKFAGKTAIFLKFDNMLAHKIEAGVDFFLMPSKYEPCGLNQLISLRYGTIPIVRHTGGLADSIAEIKTSPSNQGVGFVFYRYDSDELLQTIKKAVLFYEDRDQMKSTIKLAMKQDFSWKVSAKKYEQIYQRAIHKK